MKIESEVVGDEDENKHKKKTNEKDERNQYNNSTEVKYIQRRR